jgi:hypothetical protein
MPVANAGTRTGWSAHFREFSNKGHPSAPAETLAKSMLARNGNLNLNRNGKGWLSRSGGRFCMSPIVASEFRALLTALALVGLAACSPEPAATTAFEPASASDPIGQRLTAVRLALSDRNYGRAASLARSAQQAFPLDNQVHLLAAQSEAYLGNAGNAASAFQTAIDTGLTEPAYALSHAAFDGVRPTRSFDHIRAELSSAPSPRQADASVRPDHIHTGDVEILSDGTGDYIRAGDVVLDTRP